MTNDFHTITNLFFRKLFVFFEFFSVSLVRFYAHSIQRQVLLFSYGLFIKFIRDYCIKS